MADKNADASLKSTAGKWARIARRVANAEAEVQSYRAEWEIARSEIVTLRALLISVRPREEAWGWLIFPLRRPEVRVMFIQAPATKAAQDIELKRIRSALHFTMWHKLKISVIDDPSTPGQFVFEIVKRDALSVDSDFEESNE